MSFFVFVLVGKGSRGSEVPMQALRDFSGGNAHEDDQSSWQVQGICRPG